MPQLQHNMWVVAARTAVLSVITGGGKWVEILAHADPLYQHLIVTAERKFWRCVENGEEPKLFGVEPPKPRLEAIRIVDMASSNAWAEFAGVFARTRSAHLEHEQAKAELKSLVPEDAKEAIGHGIRAKRSKSGAVSFDLLLHQQGGEGIMQRSSQSIAALAAALAKAQIELANPEKSLIGTIKSATRAGRSRAIFAMRRCPAGLRLCAKPWASMRSPRCRPRRSIRPPASSISRPCWRMPRANGLPRTGRSAPSPTPPRRIGWARR